MPLEPWSSIITLSSTVVGVATASIGFIKILDEVKQRSARRFEERMMEIVRDLASNKDIHKASGAISLLGMCNSQFKKYHDQLFYMILGLLKSNISNSNSDTTHRVLVKSLESLARYRYREFRTITVVLGKKLASIEIYRHANRARLDLGHAKLPNIDLSNLIMRKADLGFAELNGANLSHADLRKARGIKVKLSKANLYKCNLTESRLKYAKCQNANFSNAILKTAFLEHGDFREANFGGASLQSAHFHKAKLEGARFAGADINETYFMDVDYDDRTVRSLLKAKNLKNAKFDPSLALAITIAADKITLEEG